MRIKSTLRKFSGLILIAPIVVPLFLATDILYWYMPSFYDFTKHDSRYSIVHECRPHPITGDLIRQDQEGTKYYRTTDGTPCICNSLSGCDTVTFVLQRYAWHFGQAAIFIAAAGILAFVFFKKRKALVAKGVMPRL